MVIDKRSLDRQAADWLRDAVIDGRIYPGMRLTEVSLAAEIGLSRSTVRTALQRLAGEGLVVQRPYSGWEISPLSMQDAAELYSLRAALEGMAARLASERIDHVGRAELARALKRLREAIRKSDRRVTAEADLDLHGTIIRLSGHTRLIAHCEQVNQSILIYVVSTNRQMESDSELFAAHETLVDAILSGDADLAERTACAHVRDAQKTIIENLSRMQMQQDPSVVVAGAGIAMQRSG